MMFFVVVFFFVVCLSKQHGKITKDEGKILQHPATQR